MSAERGGLKSWARVISGCVLGASIALPAHVQANACPEVSTKAVARTNGSVDEAPLRALDQRPPLEQLKRMAELAVQRSAQVGAQQLLAQAAQFDIDEIIARAGPQAFVGATVGPTIWSETGLSRQSDMQAQLNLSMSGVLYDGGRQQQLSRWRQELAKAAQSGFFQVREQVVLETVSTALERNRYRMQGQVFQQHVRKMGCLVSVLEQIVAEDRGRASELVQARKSLAQAELARDNALAISRQLEARLRRFVGEEAQTGDGIAGALTQILDPGEVLRKLDQGHDFQALRAQVNASDRLAAATAANGSPQVSWVISSSTNARGNVKSASGQAGLSINYNFFDGGAVQAAALAAARRAEALRFQYEEFTNVRVSRVGELHEAASASFDRARRLVDVLRESERVRQATFQQWAQLGRRSLFDVMSAESDHFNLRVAYVNALYDGYLANTQMRSLGGGMLNWMDAGIRP